jgi:hypothetical protein
MGARVILGVVGAAVGSIGGPGGAALGFSIGSAIGGVIEGPGSIDGPKLGDASIQTSRDGIPQPIAWGVCHVVGNIIQMNPIVEETKKVSSDKKVPSTTETRRYRTFGIGIARSYRGPILGVSRIWESDKLVYDTRTSPAIPIEETNAYAAGITIYLGTETQLPEPDFEANTGVGLTPAYRGLAYIVWHKKDITDFGSAVPPYRFEINAGGDFNATSKPYPIELMDGIRMSCSFGGGSLQPIPEDAIDLSYSVVGGNLTAILQDTGPTDDAIDLSYSVADGNLTKILLETGPTDDAIDVTYSVIDGTLRPALVQNELPTEGLRLSCSFTGGSMTPV